MENMRQRPVIRGGNGMIPDRLGWEVHRDAEVGTFRERFIRVCKGLAPNVGSLLSIYRKLCQAKSKAERKVEVISGQRRPNNAKISKLQSKVHDYQSNMGVIGKIIDEIGSTRRSIVQNIR
ncbi:MAG: hypothetical protein LBB18_04210 [Puniceicoccales bacterium]|jgi:hypothetical protein|nr:hypothetical protein [Puniceicoccales bacterium]